MDERAEGPNALSLARKVSFAVAVVGLAVEERMQKVFFPQAVFGWPQASFCKNGSRGGGTASRIRRNISSY